MERQDAPGTARGVCALAGPIVYINNDLIDGSFLETTMMDDYGQFCRPALVPLLEGIGLDAEYVRAEGDYLHYWRDGQYVHVLDLLGGYGANLFGHHHPE